MKSTQFIPAADRLLLRRLPPPPEGLIIKPQIAMEQAEYGNVIAIGESREYGGLCSEAPMGAVAKFSRFSAEEIAFDDSGEDVEFVLAYTHDIRGWFEDEPRPGWLKVWLLWLGAWLSDLLTPAPMPCELHEPACQAVQEEEAALGFRGPVDLGENAHFVPETRAQRVKRLHEAAHAAKFDA